MTISQITPIERDPERLQEILPWYLNDTLAEQDRLWVEQALSAADAAGNDDVRRQLEWDRRLAAAFEQRLDEVPADIGWTRLMQQVRADAASGESWLQRLSRLVTPVMSPRLGMALAAGMVAQTIGIGVLLSGREAGVPDTVEYRAGEGARPVVTIRALLNETITEKALREALTAAGVSIIDGPNGLGEYWMVAGSADPETVAASLREAGVISSYVIDHRAVGR